MNSYDLIAPVYDAATGDRSAMAARVRRWIGKPRLEPVRVLELACGTASVLETMPSPWEVWGIDLSKAMLRQARRKVPRGRFVCQDMTRFRLTQKFDAIICLLDSINHLTRFTGWRQTFRRARQHLVRGGVFICDVYTVRKLHRLDKGAPFVQRVGRNYFIVRASYKGRGLVHCSIAIFEYVGLGRYRLHQTEIAERAFPLSQIRRALHKCFDRVRVYGENGSRASELASRVYFVCR